MRTPALVLLLVASALLVAPSGAASPDALSALLEKLGVLPPTYDDEAPLVDDPIDLENPTVPERDLFGDLTAALGVVADPVVAVGKVISILGLKLTAGLFEGVDSGGELVVASMGAVVTHPLSSVFIASMSLVIAGAASALGILIQRYGSFAGIPLYTRIAKSALLENNIRQQIFELIKQNPGINVSEISRRLDIAWGTATHHLQKLRHEMLVSIRVASNQKCYFPNGGTYTPREMDVMSAVKHPTARQIAEFLIKQGPSCHRDVTEALGLTPALVSFHTSKLVQNGILARAKEGRHTRFTPLEAVLDPAPRVTTH